MYNNKNSRMSCFDQMKGLGIILVVLGHSIEYVNYSVESVSGFFGYLDFWLSSFHMSLFFFVSAFLQRYGEVKKNGYSKQIIGKKILNIIVPYVIFSFVFFASKKVLAGSVQSQIDIKDLIYIFIKPLSTLWFLYLLLVLYLCRVCVYKLKIPNYVVVIVSLCMCVLSYYISIPEFLRDTVLLRFLKYSFYYALGVLFCDIKEKIYMIIQKNIFLVVMGIISIVLLIIGKDIKKYYIMIPMACAMILFFYILFSRHSSRVLTKIGQKSLGIYLLHDYIICFVVILSKRIIFNSSIIIVLSFSCALLVSYGLYVAFTKIKLTSWIFKPSIVLENRGKNNEPRTED